jgi:hypothetical protein
MDINSLPELLLNDYFVMGNIVLMPLKSENLDKGYVV